MYTSNPIDVAFDSFERQGLKPLLKKKVFDDSGKEVYEDASTRDLKSLGEQSRLASIAQQLSTLSPEEKMVWARKRKSDGNAEFEHGNFLMASRIYFEALAATNLNAEDNESNVDEIVIPLVCNLAACSIQLHDWKRTILLCKEALQLRPNCLKALIRCALAYIELEEFRNAKNYLTKASNIADSSKTLDRNKIQLLLAKAERGKLMTEKRLASQRNGIANFFQKAINSEGSVKQNNLRPMIPFNGSKKEVSFILLAVLFSFGIILLFSGYSSYLPNADDTAVILSLLFTTTLIIFLLLIKSKFEFNKLRFSFFGWLHSNDKKRS